MKVQELLTEATGVTRFVYDLIARWEHELLSGSKHWDLFFLKQSNRMWTRGDGVRYKQPNYIIPQREEVIHNLVDNEEFGLDPKYAAEHKLIDYAWNSIQNLPGAKTFEVKGEFGSDEYSPAVKVGKFIFIKRDHLAISYGTTSLLRNMGVWKSR